MCCYTQRVSLGIHTCETSCLSNTIIFSPFPSRRLSPTLLALELFLFYLLFFFVYRHHFTSFLFPTLFYYIHSSFHYEVLCGGSLEIPENGLSYPRLLPLSPPSRMSLSPCITLPQILLRSFYIFYRLSIALLNSGWSLGKQVFRPHLSPSPGDDRRCWYLFISIQEMQQIPLSSTCPSLHILSYKLIPLPNTVASVLI